MRYILDNPAQLFPLLHQIVDKVCFSYTVIYIYIYIYIYILYIEEQPTALSLMATRTECEEIGQVGYVSGDSFDDSIKKRRRGCKVWWSCCT